MNPIIGMPTYLFWLLYGKLYRNPKSFETSFGKDEEGLLVLGDSITKGRGCQFPGDSFLSMIPIHCRLNLSVNLATTTEILKGQVIHARGRYFAHVLISGSGNDVAMLKKTRASEDELKRSLDELLKSVSAIGRRVVVLGNFDNLHRCRYFPQSLRDRFKQNGEVVERIYEERLPSYSVGLPHCSVEMVKVDIAGKEEWLYKDGVHPNWRWHRDFAYTVMRPYFQSV